MAGLWNISSEPVEALLYDKCLDLLKKRVGSTGFVIIAFYQDPGLFRTGPDLRGSTSSISSGVSDVL